MLANIPAVLLQVAMWVLLAVGALTGVGWLCRRLLVNPHGTVEGGIMWRLGRVYVRVLHRLRVEGREHLPGSRDPGPLVVVMNHTAGVDPVLVQAVCPFFVRFVMAQDMRLPAYEWAWRWNRVIFVDRTSPSPRGTRDAIRHLQDGGVIGIFPEGGLERPPGHLRPFEPGVGMIVRHTAARVLPILIDGTPDVDPAWASLWTPSRARLRIMPVIDYAGQAASDITRDLEERFARWSGWPVLDAPAQEVDDARATDRHSKGALPAA